MDNLIVLTIGGEVEGVFSEAYKACDYVYDWVVKCSNSIAGSDEALDKLEVLCDKLEESGCETVCGYTVKLIEARDYTR